MTKEQAFEMWMAGFLSSGEGVNGEYPFSDKGMDPYGDSEPAQERRRQFDEWWGDSQKDAMVESALRDQPLPTYSMMATHQRLLVAAAMRTAGPILELGCGWYSTPLLHEIAGSQDRLCLTFDTDEEWVWRVRSAVRKPQNLYWVPRWENAIVDRFDWRWGVVFVDSAPKESRVPLIRRLLERAEVFVIHDTEPCDDAQAYGYDGVLGDLRRGGHLCGSFAYQYTDKTHTVWTTVASDVVNVEEWFR